MNREMSIKTMSAVTGIPKGSVNNIIVRELKGIKLRPIRDPHNLTDILRANRLQRCKKVTKI